MRLTTQRRGGEGRKTACRHWGLPREDLAFLRGSFKVRNTLLNLKKSSSVWIFMLSVDSFLTPQLLEQLCALGSRSGHAPAWDPCSAEGQGG